ncbi:Piwi domain-containing protein [Thermovibrio sp.]
MEIELNGFRIKRSYIPEKVFIFKESFIEVKQEELFSKVKGELSAVILSPVDKVVLELASWKKPEKFEREVELSELPLKKEEELLTLYAKKELKVGELLRKLLPPPKVRGECLISWKVKGPTVRKVGEEFYLFFDVGFSAKGLKSLYELRKEKELSYGKVIGKTLIYDPYGRGTGERKLVEVVEVEETPMPEEVKRIEEYLKKKYGVRVVEDKTLIKIRFREGSKKVYSTFPQLLFLEKRDFLTKLRIKNQKRREILVKLSKALPFVEGTPLKVKEVLFKKPKYLVRNEKGRIVEVDSLKESLKAFPYYVPEKLQKREIPSLILIDDRLNENEVKEFLKEITKKGYFRLSKGEGVKFKKPEIVKVNLKELELNRKGGELSFALCITDELNEEEYEKAKRKLFLRNVISQFVCFKRWKENSKNISAVLRLNAYGKLGIRPFSLKRELPYGLIVGIDIGNDRFNRRSKAGSITVFLPNGTIKTLIPLSIDTGGERIDYLGELLELLTEKLSFKEGRILLIKDGNLFKEELLSLKEATGSKEVEVEVLGLKKNHLFRILSDKGRKGAVLREDLALLLPHSTEGARSLLIDSYYKVNREGVAPIPVNNSLLNTLYTLTKVNLSTPFFEERVLRLPAPVHYCDKFVKSLRRNWPVSQELLGMGCLYFI